MFGVRQQIDLNHLSPVPDDKVSALTKLKGCADVKLETNKH